MKFTTSQKIVASFVLGLGLQTNGQAQTYQMSGTLNGLSFNIGDSANSFGNFSTEAGTISSTAVINPSAATIDISGSFYLPPLIQSGTPFSESQSFLISVPPVFPNPPSNYIKTVTGNLSASVAFTGGTFYFDTGARPVTWNGSEYVFAGNVSVPLPLNISYNLTTDNQTISGLIQNVNLALGLGNVVDTTGYPTSIGLPLLPKVSTNKPSAQLLQPMGFKPIYF
jgi:hypothetical protein